MRERRIPVDRVVELIRWHVPDTPVRPTSKQHFTPFTQSEPGNPAHALETALTGDLPAIAELPRLMSSSKLAQRGVVVDRYEPTGSIGRAPDAMTARPATFGQNALVGGIVSLIVWPASSLQLGKLARSESWARCLANLTDEEMEEHGDSAAYWLAEIAGPPPLVTG